MCRHNQLRIVGNYGDLSGSGESWENPHRTFGGVVRLAPSAFIPHSEGRTCLGCPEDLLDLVNRHRAAGSAD